MNHLQTLNRHGLWEVLCAGPASETSLRQCQALSELISSTYRWGRSANINLVSYEDFLLGKKWMGGAKSENQAAFPSSFSLSLRRAALRDAGEASGAAVAEEVSHTLQRLQTRS